MERARRPGDSVWAEISDKLANAAPDVHTILTTVTRVLSRSAAGTWVALSTNPDPATSRLMVSDDAEPGMADYVKRFIAAANQPGGTPTFGLAQRVIESGTPVVSSNVPFAELIAAISPAAQTYHAANPPPASIQAVGLLIVPMRAGGASVGALGMFDWHYASSIGEGDAAWLQAIADRAALALEHARIYATERRTVERMGVIANIVLAAAYAQDLRLALQLIVQQVTSILEADAADILLVGQQDAGLTIAASAGFHSSPVEGSALPSEPGLSDPAQSRVRIDHVSDAVTMAGNPRRSNFVREGFQTCLRLPLRARGNFIGVLEMFSRSLADWDRRSLDFFETLAGIAAVGIDYAILTAPRGRATTRSVARGGRPDLNDLEMTILRMVVEGLTNREISGRVHRSENTVKAHVRRILDKTEAINRTDLARRATAEEWLEPGHTETL